MKMKILVLILVLILILILILILKKKKKKNIFKLNKYPPPCRVVRADKKKKCQLRAASPESVGTASSVGTKTGRSTSSYDL